MAGSDPGAAEASQLAAGSECWEYALSHRAPDTRDEHHSALSQGLTNIFIQSGISLNFCVFSLILMVGISRVVIINYSQLILYN